MLIMKMAVESKVMKYRREWLTQEQNVYIENRKDVELGKKKKGNGGEWEEEDEKEKKWIVRHSVI